MAGKLIETKLLHEIQPGKFLSLGFGDISCSEADIVCVSAFAERGFAANSAVGAVSRKIGQGIIEGMWGQEDHRGGVASLLETRQTREVHFRFVLLVGMGPYGETVRAAGTALNYLKMGLQKATTTLGGVGPNLQLDVSAMGVQYGYLDRRKSFDMLSEWASALFTSCPNVAHVRFVAYELDAFVDFFEALYRLKQWSQTNAGFSTPIDTSTYRDFRADLDVAVSAMGTNPKQVLVVCRTIVETVVRRLVERHLKRTPLALFSDINELRDKQVMPGFIHSYLHTCRVVGNFANHANFAASPKDAQAAMFLTLRVVEWYLGLP